MKVEIDRTTWPKPPGLPAFPASFRTLAATSNLSVPEDLLTIGLLTTPSHAAGVSLSEFWAWVRYLHAISDAEDLRLTSAFASLDAHQKTILSDDFGKGVPMSMLIQLLQLGPICDGRYFIERVAASTGADVTRTARRGPNKTPDFVAQDTTGTWHVIECKGTQSGAAYQAEQLVRGVTQKKTIRFPRGHTGQRLACGLALGVHQGMDPSVLRIVDPPGD